MPYGILNSSHFDTSSFSQIKLDDGNTTNGPDPGNCISLQSTLLAMFVVALKQFYIHRRKMHNIEVELFTLILMRIYLKEQC